MKRQRRQSTQDEKKDILKENRLLRQPSKVISLGRRRLDAQARRLLLDARPRQIDVEEQQQHAEPDNAGIKLVVGAHQRIVQQVPVYLRLDEHEVNEEHHEIVLDIFVAETPTVFAYCQAHPVARGLVVCAGVLCVQRLNWITAFNADGHGWLRATARSRSEVCNAQG